MDKDFIVLSTEKNIEANGKTIKPMAKVVEYFQVETDTKEKKRMGKDMDSVFVLIRMEILFKVNGSMIKSMDSEFINGKIICLIEEIFKIIKNMEKDNFTFLTDKFLRVRGSKIKKFPNFFTTLFR